MPSNKEKKVRIAEDRLGRIYSSILKPFVNVFHDNNLPDFEHEPMDLLILDHRVGELGNLNIFDQLVTYLSIYIEKNWHFPILIFTTNSEKHSLVASFLGVINNMVSVEEKILEHISISIEANYNLKLSAIELKKEVLTLLNISGDN